MDVANEQRGELSFKIGEITFVFEPSFERIAKLEAALGRSLLKLSFQLTQERDVTFSDVATVIEVMSINNKLSRNELGEMLIKNGMFSTGLLLSGFFELILGGQRGNSNAKAS